MNPQQFDLVNNTSVCVEQDDMDLLASQVSYNELYDAVMSLKKDKTPGPDGLNAEFYQYFWHDLKYIIFEIICEAEDLSTLPLSIRRGVISLIPKKGRDLLLIKNWRPLTMLNTDYKIIATVLSKRIKSVLPYIISEDQTGFMAGRQIATTIRKVLDFAELGNLLEIPGYIINADFEKCFDLITYEGICGALSFFNFPQRYIGYVKLLLYGFETCVTNNGHFSNFFNVTRSCHQGCPLACNLMLVCGEVLAIHIRTNQKITPYQVLSLSQTLSQYADNTQTLSGNDENSLKAILDTFQEMEGNIGLRVNLEKTIIHRIGGAPKHDLCQPLQWTEDSPSLLGIEGNDCMMQYRKILRKAQDTLIQWTHRGVSLMGKVVIVNTLVASLFVYVIQSLPSPENAYYSDFNKLLVQFLWNPCNDGRRAVSKIPLALLQANKKFGGLKLVNLSLKNAAIKISWIFRTEMYIVQMLEIILPEHLGCTFFECNITVNDLELLMPKHCTKFWRSVLIEWCRYNFEKEINKVEAIGEQIIWYNSLIRIGDVPVLWSKSVKNGLLKVRHLFKDGVLTTDIESLGLTHLQYNQLIAALPKHWIKAMKCVDDYCPPTVSKYERLSKVKKVSAVVYDEMLARSSLPIRQMYNKNKEKYMYHV